MALWYYRPNRHQSDEFGPVEFEALADMVREGVLTADSQVRKANTTLWVSIHHVRGLSFDELFHAPELLDAPNEGVPPEPVVGEPAVRDTSRFWEQALGLAAGELAPAPAAKAPRSERSRRWRIRKPKAPRLRIDRSSWRWRLGESLAAGAAAALSVAWACHSFIEQPERYPIPRRLQQDLGEGARFLFGTGPWSPADVTIISLDVSLLAALIVGIGCHLLPRNRRCL